MSDRPQPPQPPLALKALFLPPLQALGPPLKLFLDHRYSLFPLGRGPPHTLCIYKTDDIIFRSERRYGFKAAAEAARGLRALEDEGLSALLRLRTHDEMTAPYAWPFGIPFGKPRLGSTSIGSSHP